jgi:hypothetical protein
VQTYVLAESKGPKSSWIRPGDSISPRHVVMVAGPEKDISSWKGVRQGGRLETNESPARWPSEGDSSEDPYCRADRSQSNGLFWKSRWCTAEVVRELKKRESEKKRKAELMISNPRVRNSKKDLVVGI